MLKAPRAGFEPATYRLTADRSTIELPGNNYCGKIINRDPCTVKIILYQYEFLNFLMKPFLIHPNETVNKPYLDLHLIIFDVYLA